MRFLLPVGFYPFRGPDASLTLASGYFDIFLPGLLAGAVVGSVTHSRPYGLVPVQRRSCHDCTLLKAAAHDERLDVWPLLDR